MRLSSELIYCHLKERFSFSLVGELCSQLLFERPVFWLTGISMQDHGVYLCMAEDLADYPDKFPDSLLLTTGDPKKAPVCHAAFYFPENVSLLKVHNSLHELYTIYENWDMELSHILNEKDALTELLECSEKIFRNPILIHNRDFEFIAHSGIIDRNPALSFLVEGENSQEAYNNFRLHQEFQQTFSKDGPCFFPDTITGIRSVYINLFNRGRYLGRIVIPEVIRELQGSDLPLLKHLSHYIQTAITSSLSGGERLSTLRTLDYFIGKILEGDLNENSYIEKALGTFHWQNDHEYFCAVFSMDLLDVQNSTSKTIRSHLEFLIQDACIVEYRQKIVMFVNQTRNGRSQEDIIRLFTDLVRDNYLKVGCSKVYIGFRFSFQLLYRQAEIALHYGSRYMPELWIHHFNQIADKFLLENLISGLPAEMLCAPEIVAMYHYDQKHHTQYMATLKSYLDNNMHPVSTAQEMFIHRATLTYRLDKIGKLFHISLDKAYNRLFFRISILLLENTVLNDI